MAVVQVQNIIDRANEQIRNKTLRHSILPAEVADLLIDMTETLSQNGEGIPLPKIRLFAEYYKTDITNNIWDRRLMADILPPENIDLFNSFNPKLCFFTLKYKSADMSWKWRVIANSIISQIGITNDNKISVKDINFGNNQMLFENYKEFQIFVNSGIQSYSNGKIKYNSGFLYSNGKVANFGIGICYSPTKEQVLEYRIGQGLHYKMLANFTAVTSYVLRSSKSVEGGKLYFSNRFT